MTTVGWLALALAALTGSSGAPLARRTGVLAAGGRLARASAPGVRSVRAVRWSPALAGLLALGVGIVSWRGGVVLGVAASAVAGTGWLLARDLARRRASVARERALLGAVRLLVGELEAGTRPAAALAAAARVAPHCALPLHEAAVAASVSGNAAAALLRDPATAAVGSAWQLGEQAGVPLAGVLDRVAHDLAAAAEQRRAVGVALAGPRASALVLAGLPMLGIALGMAMDARPGAFLLGTGAGRAVCCAGVLLDAAGMLWMRAILVRAEQP